MFAQLKQSKRFAFVLVISVILIVTSSSLSCSSKVNLEPVTVAYTPYIETGLYWIAENQNYFSKNGLNVTFDEYSAITPAVNDMLSGKVDIVGNISEFPVVSGAFQNSDISIISCVSTSENICLVGRKDRGISQVSDLKGKKVGTIQGTITDFDLSTLLSLNGMTSQDITIINVKSAAGAVSAIVNGDVDAVIVVQPYADSAETQLGSNAFLQSAQSYQPLNILAASTKEWVSNHPDAVNKFLKSLFQAEQFLTSNPDKAENIVQQKLGLDDATMESSWNQVQFALSLNESLIAAMEAEAQWMITNNLTTSTQIPNFLDYIEESNLKTIKPESVNIIR